LQASASRVLDGIIAQRGAPKALRLDNGPELTSRQFLAWCLERKIAMNHIQPGKPMQNGHIESFNGRLRDECLNKLVPQSARCTPENFHLARRLQSRPPAQQLGLSNPGRIRSTVATPFVPADLHTAARTVGQGCPDGALTCGLDQRTWPQRKQPDMRTKGSQHEERTW